MCEKLYNVDIKIALYSKYSSGRIYALKFEFISFVLQDNESGVSLRYFVIYAN